MRSKVAVRSGQEVTGMSSARWMKQGWREQRGESKEKSHVNAAIGLEKVF